ncbi:MAG: hypothetical protein KVP17_002471 [Porospora cf. gigantea B]|uniref:uncharacterized protein n=1 Tax=Porospora cf. gigantea B TaxID=2853592 RepID=UPI003571AAF8|nr:MAG: hypothetical protein KVP17_002471 [Porospora cf. gigantea B]
MLRPGHYFVLRDASGSMSIQYLPADVPVVSKRKRRRLDKGDSIADEEPKTTLRFGKYLIPVDLISNQPFGSSFRLENGVWSRRKPLLSVDELLSKDEDEAKDDEDDFDNRHICDDNTSQSITFEDVERLKKDGLSAEELTRMLAEGSKSFEKKGVFGREKYLLKKLKKYIQQITILPPSVYNVGLAYMRRDDGAKIAGLRPDYLGMILGLGNVQAGKKVMVYDHSLGLLTGAVAIRLAGRGDLYRISQRGISNKIVDEVEVTPEQKSIIKELPLSVLTRALDTPVSDANRSSYCFDDVWFEQRIPDSTRAIAADSTADPEHRARAQHHMENGRLRKARREQEWLDLAVTGGCDALVGTISFPSASRASESIPRTRADVPPAIRLAELLADVANRFVQPDGRVALFCQHMAPLAVVQAMLSRSLDWVGVRLEEVFLRPQQIAPMRTHPIMKNSERLFSGFLVSAIRVGSGFTNEQSK